MHKWGENPLVQAICDGNYETLTIHLCDRYPPPGIPLQNIENKEAKKILPAKSCIQRS
jgi:hypothetical protein